MKEVILRKNKIKIELKHVPDNWEEKQFCSWLLKEIIVT